jgi:5'-3' exonuclease
VKEKLNRNILHFEFKTKTQRRKMKPTFILIDGSYFIVHRYECLFAWWKLHHNSDDENDVHLENNEVFVNRFKSLFHSNLKSLTQDLHLTEEQLEEVTLVVGKDCPRQNIWRNEFFPNYKGTRLVNETRKKFLMMVYEEKMFEEGGVHQILWHPKLEADDCVAIATKYLLNKYGDGCTIFIVTSDKDYLQLASNNVHIHNLNFKKLTEQKSSYNNPECDLFCKILTGDKSDNIPSVFPRCGPKTALKYYNDKTMFETKLASSDEQCKKQYELNKKIIDFNYIPEEYAKELALDIHL